MSSNRKAQMPAGPRYPDPPPADYQDIVTDKNLRALKEELKEEFEGEEFEIVSGPAW